jgi:hypothetical protein
MSTAYNQLALPTTSYSESISNEMFATLFILCLAFTKLSRSPPTEYNDLEEEVAKLKDELEMAYGHQKVLEDDLAQATDIIIAQELSHHAPAAPAPAAPAPAAPAPAAPAPKQRPIHEGLAESVQAVLSKTPQTAREICSKLSEAYPILTKSEVNSCLYTLSSKKQAKQVSSPKGSPRWTTL